MIRCYTYLEEITLSLQCEELVKKYYRACARADREEAARCDSEHDDDLYEPEEAILRKWMAVADELEKAHWSKFKLTVFAPWGDVGLSGRCAMGLGFAWTFASSHVGRRWYFLYR